MRDEREPAERLADLVSAPAASVRPSTANGDAPRAEAGRSDPACFAYALGPR
ncbi:hypothetical protein SCE1572_44585 [Sorangium cellulosum So0157-2]|uniref:Uncharacterized protein n=1 Tax=Sorangium cellulosum So0157-2 TaxID=1254432 RepID=S4Y7Y9_SORCE|nr:hypothetical protein SCE1572_44585 [Sorangium cellulosum So0157-2]